jgi:hypothetical protein
MVGILKIMLEKKDGIINILKTNDPFRAHRLHKTIYVALCGSFYQNSCKDIHHQVEQQWGEGVPCLRPLHGLKKDCSHH